MNVLSDKLTRAQSLDTGQESISASSRIRQYLGTATVVGVAFLCVIIFACLLRFVEMQYVNQTSTAMAASEQFCPHQAVLNKIFSGYLDSGVGTMEKFFVCAQAEAEEIEEVSFWQKLFGIKRAQAAEYAAEKIIQSVPYVEIAPGETKKFIVGFKNTGTLAWEREARNYISIYTYSPKYRTSVFQDSSWKLREQPAKIDQAETLPGQIGYVSWNFHASETLAPGWYEETFYLAAENLLWIPGGEFTVRVYVDGEASEPNEPETPADPGAEPDDEPTPTPAGYEAKLLLRSHQSIILKAGQTAQFTAGFKNYGTATWTSQQIVLPDVSTASSGLDNFYDSSWVSNSVVLSSSQTVSPGALGFFKFILRAPSRAGTYNASFRLTANGVSVPGGTIDIPITVTDDAGYVPPASDGSVALTSEPMMRIGLYDLETDLVVTADKNYKVVLSGGRVLGTYAAGQTVTAGYDKTTGEYYFSKDSTAYRGVQYIRFEPAQGGQNIFELVNYEHRPAWNRAYNDNKFRGVIEVRVSQTGYPWAINELPMEDYLKGLAETSDYSPIDFQKSLATAARSYAFHHYENPYKHAKGHFILDATYDQVYRGYGNELRTPKFAASVEATRGMIVHYEDEPVFTPYYSRSDGRTRSYREVWGIYNGSDYGWLQSVAAPYDAAAGNTLWGHGVGMACTDAIGMANDDYGWEDILKHYYTNITIKKLW